MSRFTWRARERDRETEKDREDRDGGRECGREISLSFNSCILAELVQCEFKLFINHS